MTEKDQKTSPSNKAAEKPLPETPRIEQLKMLLNELGFEAIGFCERILNKIGALCAYIFDRLPISEKKKPAIKKTLKKIAIIFGIIFAIFFVFVWLHPFLGFFVIIAMAVAIFYWPDIAFFYREYKKLKEHEHHE